MKHATILIDWFGPFDDREKAKKFSGRFTKGLYVLIDRDKQKGAAPGLNYIGIAECGIRNRLFRNHPKQDKVKNCQFWFGEIASHSLPPKPGSSRNLAIDLAEWLHICFVRKASGDKAFPENQQKRKPPFEAATVINHWWLPRGESEEPFKKFKKGSLFMKYSQSNSICAFM